MPLYSEHDQLLRDRAIDPTYATRLGLHSIDLADELRLIRRMGKRPSYPGIPLHRTTGLVIPYQSCLDQQPRFRVRADHLEVIEAGPIEGQEDVGSKTIAIPRYIAQAGVSVVPYWTPEALDVAADAARPIFVTEAPLKAIALACHGFPAMGMGGVLAGCHDADVRRETGEIVANEEFARVNWRGRRCYVVYDASVTDPKKPLVALGAAYIALSVQQLGGDPWLVRVPPCHPTEDDLDYRAQDQGPDDFLARNRVDAFRALVDQAEPIDPLARLARRTFETQRQRTSVAISWLGDVPTRAYLHAADPSVRTQLCADTKLPAKGVKEAVGAYAESLRPKVETAVTGLKRSQSGAIEGSVYNGLQVLRQDGRVQGLLAFDELRGAAMLMAQPPWLAADWTSTREVSDADIVRLCGWLDLEHSLKLKTQTLHELVDAVALETRFHPVVQRLGSLVWDGVDRMSTWLIDICGAEDTPYVRRVSRQSLLRHVARAYQPGCLVKQAVVLEGDQNFRKSMVIRELVGAVGVDLWSDQLPPNLGDKDAQQNLRGLWAIEIGELASKKRSDLETVKAYLSRYDDRYRPSYGRRAIRVPRSCVFWATTNEFTYLVDHTGNVRWEPVRVQRADIEKLKEIREQLWAEAVAAYKANERWWTDDPEELADHAAEVEQRRHQDPWENKLEEHLATAQETTVCEILETALDIPAKAMTRGDEMRVASILQHLGWRKPGGRREVGGKRRHVWVRPEGVSTEPAKPLAMTRTEEVHAQALQAHGWVITVNPVTGKRLLEQPDPDDFRSAELLAAV